MSQCKLIELSYYDPKSQVRLTAYADTIVSDKDASGNMLCAARFGGYPEMVRAMADAIGGGATVEARVGDQLILLKTKAKQYEKQLAHDGIYSTATLMLRDDPQPLEAVEEQEHIEQSRTCYIFCPSGDRTRLFEELDQKTAVPLIPEFQNYVLSELCARKQLRKLEVLSLRKEMDVWVLELKSEDRNIAQILEDGLKQGLISIPGIQSDQDDGFEQVESVTGYLNTFGITVADRIRNQFEPLFDPAAEPLSDEIIKINDFVRKNAGYSLYDAQLAVAEAAKRQLRHSKVALIRAECGSGKTKIGAAALAASQKGKKSFGVVMCPSHITKKWVREIGETLPDTFGMVVRSITDLQKLYALYEKGDKSVYAVISKEKARDGYMRYPAVKWNRRKQAFLCPDCMTPIQMEIGEDGTKYTENADQFFFRMEHRKNHKCADCGSLLWAPVNSAHEMEWVKIGGYGWVHRYGAAAHLAKTKNAAVREKLIEIVKAPDATYPTRGAVRRYPLSTYIKKKLKGRVDGFLCDELHEYNNASGQGDAMAEVFAASRKSVGMTATLINGYSSGIFHLLYRVAAGLMLKDGKSYKKPSAFDEEYGVVETTYEIQDAEYNSNRRSSKRISKTRQLPGVSPLVFSRFLLECTAFLSLTDMGKDLPDYEEIPIALDMPEELANAYKSAERELLKVLRTDKRVARKILSSYMNLLTVYPDQPYDQPSIIHPIDGHPVVIPKDIGDHDSILPKEEKTLEIVRKKLTAGEKVIIYTSWTRTDSQQKLLKLLCKEGIRAAILHREISPGKREEWVEKQLSQGLQVLITNPRCVETGLDLNAFTTLIFYSMGYNLFTLRQASRRSWRINQTAARVEVYLLYYADTIQAKAMKLMASKLAVAGIIEGTFTDEGLSTMSDVKDMTSQMAKELMMGIKDNVEDIAASFKKMAVINPQKNLVPLKQHTEIREKVFIPQTTRSVQAEMYEGLLEKSIEQKRRRSKKTVVHEDQLNLFDLVA